MSRRVSSPALVGRARQLAALDAALADARQGRGRLVLTEGDAGIGKTRLVETFVANAGGARTLAGGGIPLGADAPYAPVIDIFRALAALHPPAAAGLLLEGRIGPVDSFGQTRLLAAAADAVRAAAADTPLVLVVEDLHWADVSTRELVAFLARAIRRDPVLLLVTIRAEELDPAHAVGLLVAELGRLPHAQRLVLLPLGAADVAAQVQAITGVAPSAALLDRLFARAAGNPFFTEELLAAGAETTALPASVREVVLSRVARVGVPGRRLIQAAAVLGRAVAHELLGQVAEPADLRDGLDPLVRHRLLEARGDGYAFRHPLIQEAVYADLLPASRQALHARAADALAALRPSGSPADRAGHAVQIAFHWRAAGETAKALAATVRAAELAQAAHAPAEALAQYTDAMAGWATVTDPANVAGLDEIVLLERAAEAASAAGDNGQAQELAQAILARVDAAVEPVRAALRHERLGRFSWLAGDLTTSWQAYTDALRIIPDRPTPARARVLAATAQSLMLRSQHLASIDYAEQAVAVAVAVGAGAEEAHARNTLGTNLARIGRHVEGVGMIDRALRIAREVGDAAEAARCQANRTEMLVDARLKMAAIRLGEEGLREAATLGFGRVYAPAILGYLLGALYLCGRWDEIDSRSSVALDADPEAWGTVPLRMPRCRLALARGDLAAATAELAAMTAVAGATDDTQFGPALRALAAALAAARGNLGGAWSAIDSASSLAATTDDLGAHLDIVLLAVRIEADALDAARRMGQRADPAAFRARAEAGIADADSAVTRIVASGGQSSAAFALLQTCARAELSRLSRQPDADLWSDIATSDLADPHLVGYARYQQAAALLTGRRRRNDAVSALREADRLARRLGAAPLQARVATLAGHARVDLAPQATAPRPQPDPVGLTPREREVIALLHDGLSNAEIARTLYITERTASVHVSNIMRKLGVTSRLQAAAAAHRYRPAKS